MWAQVTFENYTRLGPGNGLPDRYIYDLEFDRHGIAWIGAQDGLFTFDGYNLFPFDLEQVDSAFLKGFRIFSIMPHGDSLWIGTDRGLTVLNLLDLSFSNYYLLPEDSLYEPNHDVIHGIRDIVIDRKGDIWLCPSFCGMVKFDFKHNDFIKYPLQANDDSGIDFTLLERTSLSKIIQDNHRDSIYWGIGLTGLYKLNERTRTMEHLLYEKGTSEDRFKMNRKMSLFQGWNQKIYMGSWEMGLSVYDLTKNKYWAPSLENPDFPQSLKQHLWNIYQKDSSTLYLTHDDGLYEYDIDSEKIKCLKQNDLKEIQLQFGVDFIDNQGRLWNRYTRGVNIIDPLINQFRWYPLDQVNNTTNKVLPRKILENIVPGSVTILGQFVDGIYHVNLQNQSIVEVKPDFQSHATRGMSIWGADFVDATQVLLATEDQLCLYDIKQNHFSKYFLQPPILSSYVNVLIDSKKSIWVGTSKKGLYSISPGNQLQSWQTKLPYPYVNPQFIDSREQLWVSLNQGYAKINLTDYELSIFDFQKSPEESLFRVNNFCECPNGEIWMSALLEGLGMYENAQVNEAVKKYEITDNISKLPARMIGVACNSKNEVWAMSSSGLYQINRSENSHPFYSFDYGVQDAEFLIQFLENDHLLIGGRDGFYTVDPDQLIKNNELPKPYIVRLEGNKGSISNYKKLLNKEKVELAARDNFVHIEFSAINYSLSDQVSFEYRLDGLEEEWIEAGDRRSVTYANLDGGEYDFLIRAANNEGVWNPHPYQLEIYIARPWYKTSWFYLGLIMILGALAYLFSRMKINQVRKEEQLRADYEKRLSEVKMNALQAQMNPHFIFNCLNSIDASIVRNDTKKASEYLNDFSRLIRLILQNSRSSYVMLEDDLQALKLYVKMEQLRLKNSFEFELTIGPEVNKDTIEIPPMLIQPYVENAIWHGISPLENTTGRVHVFIAQSSQALICTIEDNGIGRTAAQEIKANKKVKRKSVGMSITRERLEMINKIYVINNQIDIVDLYDQKGQPRGTRVIIKIPL